MHHRTHQRSSSHGKITDQEFMSSFNSPKSLHDPYADPGDLPFYPPPHIDALQPPPSFPPDFLLHHSSTVPQDIHTMNQNQSQGLLMSLDHIQPLEPRFRPEGFSHQQLRGARPKSNSELEAQYRSLRDGPINGHPVEGTKRSFSMDHNITSNLPPGL